MDDLVCECRVDQRHEMLETYCTNCDVILSEDGSREGAIIECTKCGVKLEIVSADPFEVYFPFAKDGEMNGWLIGRGGIGSESTSWDSQRTRRVVEAVTVR